MAPDTLAKKIEVEPAVAASILSMIEATPCRGFDMDDEDRVAKAARNLKRILPSGNKRTKANKVKVKKSKRRR